MVKVRSDIHKATTKQRVLKREDKKLAQRIRQLRRTHYMTQEELAHRLGVNISYITYIETGRRGLSLSMLYKIAKVFRIKISDIFTF